VSSEDAKLISDTNQVAPLNAKLGSDCVQLPGVCRKRFSRVSERVSLTRGLGDFSFKEVALNLFSNTNRVLPDLISNANQVLSFVTPLSDPVYVGIVSFLLSNSVAYERQLARALASPHHSIRYRIQHLRNLGIVEMVPPDHPSAREVIQFYRAEHRLERKRMGDFQIGQLRFYALTTDAKDFYGPLADAIEADLPEATRRSIRNFKGALLSKNKDIERDRKTRLGEAILLLREQRENFESGYSVVDGRKVSVRYEVTLKNESRRLGMKPKDVEALL
jgi:hypothetical protein